MVSANGRESSALRTVRSFLERMIDTVDGKLDGLTPAEARELRDDAHTALLKMQTEDLQPLVQVIRAADIEKLEGDDRGALLFMKGQEGATGPVLIIQPAVLQIAHEILRKGRVIP